MGIPLKKYCENKVFSGHQKKFHLMQLKKSAKGMNSSD